MAKSRGLIEVRRHSRIGTIVGKSLHFHASALTVAWGVHLLLGLLKFCVSAAVSLPSYGRTCGHAFADIAPHAIDMDGIDVAAFRH